MTQRINIDDWRQLSSNDHIALLAIDGCIEVVDADGKRRFTISRQTESLPSEEETTALRAEVVELNSKLAAAEREAFNHESTSLARLRSLGKQTFRACDAELDLASLREAAGALVTGLKAYDEEAEPLFTIEVWHAFEDLVALLSGAEAQPTRAEVIEHAAMMEALGFETPWPITDVLDKLIDATRHLLGEHACDRHGYEAANAAVDSAVVIRGRIDAALSGNVSAYSERVEGMRASTEKMATALAAYEDCGDKIYCTHCHKRFGEALADYRAAKAALDAWGKR